MSKSLFLRETVWLWVGILLMAVVPQLSIFRVGPLSSFFLESGALLMALFFVLFTIFSGSLKIKIPTASIYFIILAIFWAIHSRAMDLTYVALSDMVSWTFLVLALMCWACSEWVRR
ncbi:MAG: polymerase, partial [Kingella sp. (in: b-proteobacteria)]